VGISAYQFNMGQYKGETPWRNNRDLVKDIDALPHGPSWDTATIDIGEGMHKRTHVVFKRNIIEVVKELIGNIRFKGFMRYAPERHWTSHRRRYRVYDEMWSGNWWWRTQVSISMSDNVLPLTKYSI
jgi:hypothetical protein